MTLRGIWPPLFMAMSTLACLGIIVFSVSAYAAPTWQVDEDGRGEDDLSTLSTTSRRSCWIFNHMNKAGGSTVKYMLKPYMEQHHLSYDVYDTSQWLAGAAFAKEYLSQNNTLTWGTYCEGLRPYGGNGCKWFTIFRHPVPRMVSAYFYCKKSPQDSLCARAKMNASEVDLATFAEHWGNFGFRQFMLTFIKSEDVIASEIDDGCKGDVKEHKCPGWYRLKLALQRLPVDSLGAPVSSKRNVSTGWQHEADVMCQWVKPVLDTVSNAYHAVGILENWESTLRLFNVALNIPSYDWPTSSKHIGKKNWDSRFHVEEEEALATAWDDPELAKHMQLDLLLYKHAQGVNAEQLRRYKLM